MLKESNKNLESYFDENSPIKDDFFNAFKNMIACRYCGEILKDPLICIECQESFCSKCTKELNKKIHQCIHPSFQKNISAISLLENVKYLCNNCKNVIPKKNIEKHLKDGCIKIENPLINEIFRKESLQKLTDDELKNLSKEKNNINHLTCK